MDLAKGEKILDDPTRLRRSIKKEAKDKQKKAKEWQERNEAVQKKKEQRQDRCDLSAQFNRSAALQGCTQCPSLSKPVESSFAGDRRICSSGSTKSRPGRRQSERRVSWALALRAARLHCGGQVLRPRHHEDCLAAASASLIGLFWSRARRRCRGRVDRYDC